MVGSKCITLIITSLILISGSVDAVTQQAESTNSSLATTFYGKVFKVDGHNVMTVGDSLGNLRFLSLAYVSTPVRGEPYFEPVNAYLKEFEGQWFQFTIASYGRKAKVQPADQTSVNSAMVREGLAAVNMPTNPPASLIDQGMTASKEKKGLWGEDEKFQIVGRRVGFGVKLTEMLKVEGKRGLVPYAMDSSTMTAYPIACVFLTTQNLDIALTEYVAKRKGYSIAKNCDGIKAQN